MKEATLYLENSLEFQGYSFGYEYPTDGEVVFDTSMVGYPENLTDPSYSGQIICITFPLVGNYGVPENILKDGISTTFESGKIYAKGVIISDYSFNYSHWSAVKSLDQWLKEQKVPGIYCVDTREITKILRDTGSMGGSIVPHGFEKPNKYSNPDISNQVAEVSCTEVLRYGNNNTKKVVLIDCGVKHSILRALQTKDIEIIRVPWDYDFTSMDYDGVIISNGPGNPEHCSATIANVAKAIKANKAVFGIGLGHQILALASGAKVTKLKSGHRGHNQPVKTYGSDRCYITAQNHSYIVENESLQDGWNPYFTSLNDGSNEGIIHESKRFFSVQFTPEAAGEAHETEFLYDNFIKLL